MTVQCLLHYIEFSFNNFNRKLIVGVKREIIRIYVFMSAFNPLTNWHLVIQNENWANRQGGTGNQHYFPSFTQNWYTVLFD